MNETQHLQARLKSQEQFMELEKGRLETCRQELDDARTQRASKEGEYRSEVSRLEQVSQQKSESIALLNTQIDQLTNTLALEFPLIMPMKQQPSLFATQ